MLSLKNENNINVFLQSFESNISSTPSAFQGWTFYLPTFLAFTPSCTRLMFFKFFYESMLLSILKGWSMKRPIISLDETPSIRDWKRMKNEVKEWINFYQNILVSSIQVFNRYGGTSASN